MKQIDNRQKIMTKSRAERARLGKHDPRILKEKGNFDHTHVQVAPETKEEEKNKTTSSTEQSSLKSPPEIHPKTGRNDPCPCGSGKKYKKCCLK